MGSAHPFKRVVKKWCVISMQGSEDSLITKGQSLQRSRLKAGSFLLQRQSSLTQQELSKRQLWSQCFSSENSFPRLCQ